MAKLTAEQKRLIKIIEAEAIRAGVDPDFAVALANLESGFRHVPADDKKSTAFGPFQVNRATAEANGVDYDKMKESPELAIKAGIMNIARHANNPQFEGDPFRIAAAHRYGENSDYAKTGDISKIDKTLAGYLASALEHFPNEEFPATVYTKPKEEKSQEAPQARADESRDTAESDLDMGSKPLGAANPQEQAAIDAEQDAWERKQAAATLGLTGAGFGAVKVPTLKILHRLSKALPGSKVSVEDAAKLAEKVATGQVPTAGAPGTPTAAPGAPGAPQSVVRVQPQGGSGTFNYGKAFGLTDIEAQRALDMTKGEGGVHDLTTQRRAATQKIERLFPTETWRENPLYGGLITTDPGVGSGPRASYVSTPEGTRQLPPRQPIATGLPPPIQVPTPMSAPDKVQKGFQYVMGSSPVKYGLAGAGIGYNLEDAYQNLFPQGGRERNIPAGLASLGAAGASGLTLVPSYAARANPAAIALTTTGQVLGDLGRGDRQSAAESGLTGAVMLAPRRLGPLGAIFYSPSLNKGEEEELKRRRALAPTITAP
jgi:hypothetical protein